MGKKKEEAHIIESTRHTEEKRRNIPPAEAQPIMSESEQKPVPVMYERRNKDLDPQLVWRGKDEQDRDDLSVPAPPLYIQEKVHPKALIDDLIKQTEARKGHEVSQIDMFSDFNGLPDEEARTEFYQHDANWSNRMILGDSLQVMASLAEREELRGKVQCIYFDPPYGIKFNSNFQWSTTSTSITDGKKEHITREPEQVKAFRDTWRDGIHSYLSYLRDRLMAARDLLSEFGSIFVQIGDENVHRVRAVMDEVFGGSSFIHIITIKKAAGISQKGVSGVTDFILWYAKNPEQFRLRRLFISKPPLGGAAYSFIEDRHLQRRRMREAEKSGKQPLESDVKIFCDQTAAAVGLTRSFVFPIECNGVTYNPPFDKSWQSTNEGMTRLRNANRLAGIGKSLRYIRYQNDFPVNSVNNLWADTASGSGMNKIYVVQTNTKVVERCILMATDPGDLVLDPTCGSGSTAYVAEKWGRRWITIDTSRVALALARSRIMGARYPFYLLADSRQGQQKEAELSQSAPSAQPVYGNIRHGFVYRRVPHITLKSIAHNTEIDVIYEKYQKILEPLRSELNGLLNKNWEEWDIPRKQDDSWPSGAKTAHSEWWKKRIDRQREIDYSIESKADSEYLLDQPYEDKKTVRVAGPFTVESASPHRYLGVDENDRIIDPLDSGDSDGGTEFAQIILENLRTAGIQQAHKEDKIDFSYLNGWPGDMICAEGHFNDGYGKKRAGVFIGPEFGTVSRQNLVAAAREAGDADFDVLVSCAFSYEAQVSEFDKLGRIRVFKARMNADLHMADNLKKTETGNLFVIFGEPDIAISTAGDDRIQVQIRGVDVFDPKSGYVRSDNPDGIACWFIDTDYNEESFFVRHAYFLGAKDPYKALKTTLRAEIDQEAWESLHGAMSRPFEKPASGKIAVKVINHLGDEVMKVFKVE